MPFRDSPVMELTALSTSFFIWTGLYFCVCVLNRKCSPEWNCRIVAFIHASLATILSFISAVLIGPWPLNYIGQENLPFHAAIITISAGYFLYDILWCLWYRTEGPVVLAHHVVSIFGLCYTLFIGWYGCETSAIIGISEVSNPLLQMGWFFKESGRYKSYNMAAYAFVIVFFCARLGLGTVLFIHVQINPDVALIFKLGGQAFHIINIIFCIQIIFFIKK